MLCGAAAAVLLALMVPAPANAQLLPAGFFKNVPPGAGQAAVEAAMLAYDTATNEVSAEGDVILRYGDYTVTAERITYNQKTRDVFAEGNAAIRDPDGTIYRADRIKITDQMKRAFIESLTLTTVDGATVTADSTDYNEELQTILTNAEYSPCGLCIDKKGRRIGWKVRASKMIYDGDRAVVFLEGPQLELLGVPVAWMPWMAIPDPSQPRAQGFRIPSISYEGKRGLSLEVPYFVPVSPDIDLLLTPTLMSRQGLLMAAEITHRIPWGTYDVAAFGTYQLDPSAFAGTVGDTRWRGAIQSTGTFRPVQDWTVGWSYTAFSDAAFLIDYDLRSNKNVVNEIYATYLTRDTYFDARLRSYNLLGNQPNQDRQGAQIPRIEAVQYADLGPYGHVEVSANVTGILRRADHLATVNLVNYVYGYEEQKIRATLEGSWQDQYVLPGGLLATPYGGLRIDAGYVESPTAPVTGSLLSATPIAAMDIRWPLVANNGLDSHLFEPVAQLVYRGSSVTSTGITNDDAQSFVFDDTLLFDYNRFSGQDRQETGLRANVGGRYLANFSDGSWLQLIGGQSFFLAGSNALGIADTAQTGNSTGLGGTASYVVLGAQGSPGAGLTFGAKTQIDPGTFSVMRASAAGTWAWDAYRFGAAYTYIPANPAIGTVADQHEVEANVSGPLPIDYWKADAGLSWDLASNQFLGVKGGLTYDDGYLQAGAFAGYNGTTHESPGLTFGLKFRLRGPQGEWGL